MIETKDYVLFWKDGLSNFAYSPFTEHGIKFFCVEQYFMYHKALLFKDYQTAEKILNATKPDECKRLGRMVKNYTDKWDEVREEVMFRGNYLKYTQHEDSRRLLLNPNWFYKDFVEANPYDTIWAIGLAPNDPLAGDSRNWKGQNLLGKCLNRVRKQLWSECRRNEIKYDEDLGIFIKNLGLIQNQKLIDIPFTESDSAEIKSLIKPEDEKVYKFFQISNDTLSLTWNISIKDGETNIALKVGSVVLDIEYFNDDIWNKVYQIVKRRLK